ncbi:MAG: LptE family protein [Bacteroidaceae bacterium]|nr:LptE family protein [Bacteroidaceae bacterium]MBR3633424.1 LptE family protein [Bacteroidaceae bacterium]
MVWKMLNKVALLTIAAMLMGCSVSYKFTSTSIDYSRIKTIEIADFPLRSAYVWAPMHSMFNNELADAYATQTKLTQVKRQGDLQLSGEIVEYNQFNKGVSADGYSNLTQLKMTVNVRFVNNKKHADDFERRFTASAEYDASQQLNSVQEELVTQMIKDIVDQILNATVANW